MNRLSKFKVLLISVSVLSLFTTALAKIGLFSIPGTTENDLSLSRTSVSGYPFHTEVYGDPENPPLVVIHGGPGGDFRYLLELKQLSDRYYVLFYDQRGSGLSPRRESVNFTIESFLEDLRSIVKIHSSGKKAILIGHSWGGMLATAYIARFPNEISKAVIMEPGMLTKKSAAIFLGRIGETQSNLKPAQIAKMIQVFLQSLFVKIMDGDEMKDYILTKMMGMGNGPPYQCPGEALPENSFVRAGYSVFGKMIIPIIGHPEKFDYDLTIGIKSFKGKILLLSSECSFIGYDFQKENHESLFPESTLHILLKGTGHNMITLKPEESIRIIRKFLETGNPK